MHFRHLFAGWEISRANFVRYVMAKFAQQISRANFVKYEMAKFAQQISRANFVRYEMAKFAQQISRANFVKLKMAKFAQQISRANSVRYEMAKFAQQISRANFVKYETTKFAQQISCEISSDMQWRNLQSTSLIRFTQLNKSRLKCLNFYIRPSNTRDIEDIFSRCSVFVIMLRVYRGLQP